MSVLKDTLAGLEARRARLRLSLRDLADLMGTGGFGHLGDVLKGKKNTTSDYIDRIDKALTKREEERGLKST